MHQRKIVAVYNCQRGEIIKIVDSIHYAEKLAIKKN